MLPNWLYGKSLRKLQEILNSGGQTAAGVSYSNTESGLEATNAQAAIDELTDDGPTVKTINVTAESGVSFSSSTALKQCGKNVILNFQTTLSIAANTEALLFTLPVGSRPSMQLLFPAFNSNSDTIVGFMRIKANGEVSISSTKATAAGTYYGGNAQFFAS